MNNWKSSSLPLCGVAVNSRKLRVRVDRSCPRWYRLVYLTSPPKKEADILWASSQITRSQALSPALSRAWTASSRASLSRRAMASGVSTNQLPVRGGFQFVIGHDFEGQLESTVEFILPLLGQTPWAHHQTTFQVSPDDELLYQQASHDGLAGPRVICQQEAEGLARQHRLVYRRDLVGKRIYDRGYAPRGRGQRDEPDQYAAPLK